ncbi:MAG: BA14K family protein [Rhizobiales bacterium]|nr:BA14K family protein [Hyphomicrobiales bacterium]
MLRMSFAGRAAGFLALFALTAGTALAAPIAKPGLAPSIAGISDGILRVTYDAPRRPYCKLESKRYFYNWNPGRFDEWNGVGPYKHKHFGGHRWHDLNYNGCAPWWRPEAYGTTKARRAFKQAADNPHVVWCFERYRSYDPSTDSYIGPDGRKKRCVGPKK